MLHVARTLMPLTLLSCAVLTLFAACGGGEAQSDMTAVDEDDRAEALAARQPVTISSHGPNVVSTWDEIANTTANAPPSPTGATPEERRSGPDIATVHIAIYDAVIAIAGTHKPFAVKPKTPAEGASMDAA